MERGLPRPLNGQGRPVPYVAAGPNKLGDASSRRRGEVWQDNICQVCGLSINWPALIVVKTSEPGWWPDGQIIDGWIHENECFCLAWNSCPYLLKREGFVVLRVGPDDVVSIRGAPHFVPAERHSALRVPFERLCAAARSPVSPDRT